MIQSIQVTNHIGETFLFELGNPWAIGLALTSIDGLGPTDVVVDTSRITSADGTMFNSAHSGQRNIVFKMRFVSADVEKDRQQSYKIFPQKKRVDFVFNTTERSLKTWGIVESNEPNIFSKEEGTSVSIICPPAFFEALDEDVQISTMAGIQMLFEFPFSNESLSENLIEFGSIELQKETVIQYEGDTDTSVLIHIHTLGAASGITIHNTGTRETMRLDASLLSGDDVYINTERGNKYVKLIRNGIETNLLNSLDINSVWFRLVRGDNVFAFVADTGGENIQMEITHRPLYVGV